MKKTSLFLMVMVVIILGSCKKDENSGESFSKGTPGDHKIAMQNDATDVAAKLDGMQNLTAMAVMEEFMDLMEDSNEPYSAIENTLKSAVALKSGAKAVFVSSFEDNAFSFNDWYKEQTGIYTYNEETDEWDKKSSSSELKYMFSSEENGDIVILVSDFKAQGTSNPEFTPEFSDLLTSAKVSLTADGKSLMTIAFSASYDKEDIPTSLEQSITMEEYAMSFKASRSASSVALDYSYKFSNANILSAHFDSKGDFDLEKFEDTFETDMEDAMMEQDVLESSNIWIALGNFKFHGFANWKDLAQQIPNIDEDSEESLTEAEAKAMAKALDNNVKIYLRYNDNNKVIAKSQFYADSYDDYDEIYWKPYMRMLFADGSYMNESFLEDGFAEYLTMLSEIMDVEEE